MPCQSGPNPPEWEIQSYKNEIDKVTQMLCALCGSIEQSGMSAEFVSSLMPKKVATWWRNHKAIDESRKVSEEKAAQIKRFKENALSKLTKKEKAALGLK